MTTPKAMDGAPRGILPRTRAPRARPGVALGAALLLTAAPAPVGSESVTLKTLYPAPVCSYSRLITAYQTVLARDSGAVLVGAAGGAAPNAKLVVIGGNVAVGAASAAYPLDVAGTIQGRNALVQGLGVVTQIICDADTGLRCSKNGNTLSISR